MKKIKKLFIMLLMICVSQVPVFAAEESTDVTEISSVGLTNDEIKNFEDGIYIDDENAVIIVVDRAATNLSRAAATYYYNQELHSKNLKTSYSISYIINGNQQYYGTVYRYGSTWKSRGYTYGMFKGALRFGGYL